MKMHSLLKVVTIFWTLTFFVFTAVAKEIKGKIIEVEGSRVKIDYQSDYVPRNGDRVTIGIIMDDDFIPVKGKWVVIDADAEFIWADHKSSESGTPAIGYLAIIDSQNPRKKSELTISKEIPSLNAKVKSIKFYEAGYYGASKGQKDYKTQFRKSISRYIWWELKLKYPAHERRIDFGIEAVYYKPNGSILARQTKRAYIKKKWKNSWHTYGWGWKNPGKWKLGRYRVDLFIAGQKVASESFDIIE